MRFNRIIPSLLLYNRGLVKTTKFRNPVYIGDPLNAIKVFNEKEVDELVLIDISDTPQTINFDFLQSLISECFMPVSFAGSIKNTDHIAALINLGIEKVIIGSAAVRNPKLIERASKQFGSQAIVVAIDVRKNWFGKYEVFIHSGKERTGISPLELACQVQQLGAGEILLTFINSEGTMRGYDIELIRGVAACVTIPVIANGGAGSINDFVEAIEEGKASACAAGSMFVFEGKHKAVLITYPSQQELNALGVIQLQ